jgi:hypothetical protein
MRWTGYMCITLPWPNRPWALNTAHSDEVVDFGECRISMRDERAVLGEALGRFIFAIDGECARPVIRESFNMFFDPI